MPGAIQDKVRYPLISMEKKEHLKTQTASFILKRYRICRDFLHCHYSLTVKRISVAAFLFLLVSCGDNQSAKFNQYYVQGEKLYVMHCSNCHQKDGSGLGRVYPPVNISDYMEHNFEEVICLIKFGKTGELIVNGQEFNQPMKGIITLSDLEIAEIATYIYNTWSHKKGIVEVKDVSKVLKECENGN